MRRALFLAAMGVALALPAALGPARAAEKPPATPLKLVTKIDSLIATASRNIVTIQAKGAVGSGGWHIARLRPMKSGTGDAHTIVVEFVAAPPLPSQAVIEGLLPIAANATVPLRRGVFSVRAISGSNEITTQILK